MEIKNCLPEFEKQIHPIKDTGLEVFQKLYNEKAAHMDLAKILNFYGPAGTGKNQLLRDIYNRKKSLGKTVKNPPDGSTRAETETPVMIYCNIRGGISSIISEIVKQSSSEYDFSFPLTCICLYILSRTDEEQEAALAFPLPELRTAAIYLGTEPEFQYLKLILDGEPIDQNGYSQLYGQLLFDENAPRSLRKLIETNAVLAEKLFTWFSSHLSDLSAFFTSFFVADMEENLKEHTKPAVILLDGIDNYFASGSSAVEQKNKEKWLCGITGLLTTMPKVFWVLISNRKLNWKKDCLPDWKDALIQKAITVPENTRSVNTNTPDRFTAAIWNQQKNTLDEKVQCVLQGLGIFNFDLAFQACTTLIEEYQDIPGFEAECSESIKRFIITSGNDLPQSSDYYCYNTETLVETRELIKYKFKAFYFALRYYTAKINRIHLGSVNFEKKSHRRKTCEEQLIYQKNSVKELIDNTEKFISEKESVRQTLREFYFTSIFQQLFDWIDLGLYSVAVNILDKLKAVTENQKDMFSSIYELGYAYLLHARDNNSTEATKRIERIYKENLELAGKNSPTNSYLLNILSYVRSYVPGQELTAYRERRKCAFILKKVLGKDSRQTIRAISMLGAHLVDNGRSKAAVTLNHVCYHQASGLYGKNDLVTLKCASQYAYRLQAKGEYLAAFKLRENVANKYEEIYGKYDADTLSELESLAYAMSTLSKEDSYDDENETVINSYEAKEKELHAREDLLYRYQDILQDEKSENGKTVHPLIRDAVINVCGSMQNCNRSLEEIIQFAENTLGENDPGFITVLNNAAINDYNNGKTDQTVNTVQRAIVLCKNQGIETYEGLKQYINCRISLVSFLIQNDSTTKEKSLSSCKTIKKDCETLMKKAKKENNKELVTESKLFVAKRFYNIAQIANYYDESNFALEILEKAIDLKQSVSAVKDADLSNYLKLKNTITHVDEGDMEYDDGLEEYLEMAKNDESDDDFEKYYDSAE